MSLFWLTYRKRGRIGVVIIEAGSLILARMRAGVKNIDRGAEFAEGHKLDQAAAAAVPAAAIGRMLTVDEAEKIIAKIERSARPR